MFTVCSKCNLRLTVTATDLRAAQGYVRCGRCHNVFNALAALADDPGRLTETPAPPATPEPAPAPEAQADPADTDASMEFNPASTNINEVFIEASPDERTGTFESIILVSEEPAEVEGSAQRLIAPQALSAPLPPDPTGVGDVQKMRDALADPQPPRPATPEPAPQPAKPAPEPVREQVARQVAEPAASVAPVATHEVAPATPVAAVPAATAAAAVEFSFTDSSLEPAPVAAEPPAVDAAAAAQIASALEAVPILEEPQAAPPRVPRWLLPGAAALLAVCLIAQVVHHYRADLADTATLRGPLTALYQNLGRPLEPHWDMASYEVRQLGASTDGAPGQLVVRASIGNRARADQPLPLLRVVMQDRFGNRVAARDLKPLEYLGRGAPQVSLLGPGQRIDVQVAMQDPGQVATGFEIDACMPGHDHTVMCANDPGSH
jgi:predicted Zn finger-like uncharacterized protein